MLRKILVLAVVVLVACMTATLAMGQACASVCQSYASNLETWMSENGTLDTLLHYTHYTGIQISDGGANGNGPAISCAVTVAAAVRSCLISCAVDITFNAKPFGVGTTVNFPPDAIFTSSYPYPTSCLAKSGPVGKCVTYDYVSPAIPWNTIGQPATFAEHATGAHEAYSTVQGSCAYFD